MPLSIDDFESGNLPRGPSVPTRVITFLHSNDDMAFTRSEIASVIDANANTVGTALSRLKERELVRHRGEYWAITDDSGRVAAAYDLHATSERLDEEDGGINVEMWEDTAPDSRHPSEPNDEDG